MKKLLRIGLPALAILLVSAVFVFAGSPAENDSASAASQKNYAATSDVHGSCSALSGK